MLCFLILVLAICGSSGRDLVNPVMNNIFTPEPSVLFHDGLYYAVSSNYGTTSRSLSLHVSENLQNWKLAGHIFDEASYPGWTDDVLREPEIRVLGENQFRLYFEADDRISKRRVIGSAFAMNIEGPYYALSHPLKNDTNIESFSPHVFNNNGSLYMYWTNNTWVYVQSMNSDGLSFENEEYQYLINVTQPWEESLYKVFIFQRKEYYYLFYSGISVCSNYSAIGVARSTHPLGPFEKDKKNPILTSYDNWLGIFAPSIVTDIDEETAVLFYEAEQQGTSCASRLLCGQAIKWDSSGWPTIPAVNNRWSMKKF